MKLLVLALLLGGCTTVLTYEQQAVRSNALFRDYVGRAPATDREISDGFACYENKYLRTLWGERTGRVACVHDGARVHPP